MEDAIKRKRQSDPAAPSADAPAAKRLAPGAPSSEDTRAAIASVYAAYDALHRSSASQPSEEAAAHYAVLLNAAQGNEAVQRLAARLLPKFAPRFPAQAGAAAAALQGLASLTLSDAGATQAVHADSVEGLRRVLLAATGPAAEAVATDSLRFALERLAHQESNGTTHNGANASLDALAGVARAAFVAAPRAVLAATLALAGETFGAGLQSTALLFLRDHLLAPARAEDLGNSSGRDATDKKQTLLVRRLGVSKAGDPGSEDAAWAASTLQELIKKGAKGLSSSARAAAEVAARELVPRQPTPPAPAAAAPGNRENRGKKGKRTPSAPLGPPLDGLKRPKESSRRSLSPSPEEGELDGGGGRPSPPSGTAGLPRPGGAITLAAPCLHIAGLPRGVDQRTLGVECDRHGSVTAVVLAPASSEGGGGNGGAGYVTFRSMRDAGAAYEALADQTPFRGSGGEPLHVRFCPEEPAAAAAAPPPPPSHVWVLDVASSSEEASLLRFLRAETGAEPVGVTPLRARVPGALLAYTSPAAASAAADALHQGWPPRGTRRRGGSPTPPLPPTARAMPPLEYATESLWVGQVPLGRDTEQEMIATFSRFGAIHSHKILNRTACAFINFVDKGSAIEARRTMDGARIARSTIVVEFKGEKEYWERAGRGGGGSRGGGRERERERERGRERDWEQGRGGGRDRSRDYGASPFAGAPQLPGSRGGSPGRGRGGRRSRSRSLSRDRGGRRRDESGVAAWPSANRLFSEFSEQLPPAPQQQQAAAGALSGALPPAGPFSSGAPVLWQGFLSKQRQPQAEVACIHRDVSAAATGGWAAAEPAGWPGSLDVQNRIPTDYVCSSVLPAHPAGARAVLRLVPAPGRSAEPPRLAAFASYLRGKRRTGVVDLGPGPQPGAPRGRVLYLIPADEGTCRAVGLRWGPGDAEGMLAVVVPRPEGG